MPIKFEPGIFPKDERRINCIKCGVGLSIHKDDDRIVCLKCYTAMNRDSDDGLEFAFDSFPEDSMAEKYGRGTDRLSNNLFYDGWCNNAD